MTKELMREVWSSQYLPGSCQTYCCWRDVNRAVWEGQKVKLGVKSVPCWCHDIQGPGKLLPEELLRTSKSAPVRPCSADSPASPCHLNSPVYAFLGAFILLCKGLGGFLSNQFPIFQKLLFISNAEKFPMCYSLVNGIGADTIKCLIKFPS